MERILTNAEQIDAQVDSIVAMFTDEGWVPSAMLPTIRTAITSIISAANDAGYDRARDEDQESHNCCRCWCPE
jgi:hypothetical protein